MHRVCLVRRQQFRIAKGEQMHRIIIVGGGAGGLELAMRLGDRYGARRRLR
jgi:NADH:ubiquinone reductase (H+-translocating)